MWPHMAKYVASVLIVASRLIFDVSQPKFISYCHALRCDKISINKGFYNCYARFRR
jgi:hypothetical protein